MICSPLDVKQLPKLLFTCRPENLITYSIFQYHPLESCFFRSSVKKCLTRKQTVSFTLIMIFCVIQKTWRTTSACPAYHSLLQSSNNIAPEIDRMTCTLHEPKFKRISEDQNICFCYSFCKSMMMGSNILYEESEIAFQSVYLFTDLRKI